MTALATRELYYTRCPVPTATGLAVGLDALGPALRSRHDLSLLALQDVADPGLRRHHFEHGLVHLVREGGNIPALWARGAGVPTRLLGLTWLDEYQAVVTRPGSPLRSAADLAGTRLAIPAPADTVVDVSRASSLRGLERVLATAGLGLDAARLVETAAKPLSGPTSDGRGEQFDPEVELLERGAVDAIWLKGAGGLAAVRAHGLREVVRIDRHPDPLVRVNNGTPRTLTVRQELIDERPDVVGSLLDVLAGAQATVGDRLWSVLARETHQPPEIAAQAYEQVAPDSLVPSLAPARLDALQHQADFLHGHGFIPARVDVAEWIWSAA